MTVYSARLGDGSNASAGSTDIFTAATGKVTVVRCVHFVLDTGCTEILIATTSGITLASIINAAGASLAQTINLRQVVIAGEVVKFVTVGAGGSCTVSGYELS